MKNTLLLFAILFYFNVNSQITTINFNAVNFDVDIDSVLITKMYDCSSVIIYPPDSLILEIYQEEEPGSVLENLANNNSMSVFPNPIDNLCYISFHVNQTSKSIIRLFDISGRLICLKEKKLFQGKHTFEISNLSKGMYVVDVKTGNDHFSDRIVSTADYNGSVNISYNSFTINNRMKSKVLRNSYSHMIYEEGDVFMAKAWIGNHAKIKLFVPTQDTVIDFYFIECIDIENNIYPVVNIGEQLWMASNMVSKTFRNGDIIQTTEEIGVDINQEDNPVYYWDNHNFDVDGKLYTWYAANDYRGLCPSGWRIPRNEDWDELIEYLGGNENSGEKLKDKCMELWEYSNIPSNNSTGFSALPTGFRYANGVFEKEKEIVHYWTSTENNENSAYRATLLYNQPYVDSYFNNKKHGFTVRCISSTTPVILTSQSQGVTHSSAIIGGSVVYNGGETVFERGVFWGTDSYPSQTGIQIIVGSGVGEFNETIVDLNPNTTYYYQAYAKNNIGIAYGKVLNFTTDVATPVLTTNIITEITSNSAVSGGSIIFNGGSSVLERGIVWSTNPNPTTENYNGITIDGAGSGSFTSVLSGLSPNTQYFVRAYATNEAGTAYGNEQSFVTDSE